MLNKCFLSDLLKNVRTPVENSGSDEVSGRIPIGFNKIFYFLISKMTCQSSLKFLCTDLYLCSRSPCAVLISKSIVCRIRRKEVKCAMTFFSPDPLCQTKTYSREREPAGFLWPLLLTSCSIFMLLKVSGSKPYESRA